MSEDAPKKEPCNCGHDLETEHGPFGCSHGCATSYCETGEPALKDGVTEHLDEDGIPWL